MFFRGQLTVRFDQLMYMHVSVDLDPGIGGWSQKAGSIWISPCSSVMTLFASLFALLNHPNPNINFIH